MRLFVLSFVFLFIGCAISNQSKEIVRPPDVFNVIEEEDLSRELAIQTVHEYLKATHGQALYPTSKYLFNKFMIDPTQHIRLGIKVEANYVQKEMNEPFEKSATAALIENIKSGVGNIKRKGSLEPFLEINDQVDFDYLLLSIWNQVDDQVYVTNKLVSVGDGKILSIFTINTSEWE